MHTILNEIQLKHQTLTETEKKIADYVVRHNEHLLNIHIKELAGQIDVSVAAITRFCKKIGVGSFVEFKILLRDAVKEKEEVHDAIHEVHQIYNSVINSTNSLTNIADYQLASEWILEAKRIHVYGLGSSGLSAEELKFRLSRMGLNINTHLDSHSMIIASSILNKDDVVIAISSSGQTKEVVDAMELASRREAKIISITDYSESSLTKSSDLMLYTSSVKSYHAQGFLNSQLSILYTLDILSMLLAEHQHSMETYQKTLQALDEYKKI
ncbi:MurR/RpiR family transcriptional regulator [Gracilibacillus salinarum]|uniref:MurR/RpiR family transcriptional regulator n=1 Tax=Gracilibacillus salinarum TaxID=2932255 RepID=A0ABY4GGN4_9BACI|nr:MurR/RpiR family transcriptional regulator [Gracilibacillus salinarum]UOQ83473.1 MurR/RpiR family transcriptional regulator [Gracilibacillus salinarum]